MRSTVTKPWTESQFRAALTPYCFGELDDAEREAVEQHLFECDVCWNQLQKLEAAVRALRSDTRVPAMMLSSETIVATRLSENDQRSFGGHLRFVLLTAVLHACLYAASVWTELGYAFDRFGHLAVGLTPIVFGAVFAGTVIVMSLCSRGMSRRNGGLVASGVGLIVMAGVLAAGLAFVLPHEPTIAATITTRSAFAGYVKNIVVLFLPLAVLYVLVPFHAVLGFEREIKGGHAGRVLSLLSGDRRAFQPRGMWYLSPTILAWLLSLPVLVSVVSTPYFLDAVAPGPYLELFTIALYVRILLWFLLACVGLAWYARRLNDLKQLTTLLREMKP